MEAAVNLSTVFSNPHLASAERKIAIDRLKKKYPASSASMLLVIIKLKKNAIRALNSLMKIPKKDSLIIFSCSKFILDISDLKKLFIIRKSFFFGARLVLNYYLF